MKFSATLLLTNILLTPSIINCWYWGPNYFLKSRSDVLHRRDYEPLGVSQSSTNQVLKDHRASTIRRRNLDNPQETKLSLLDTDANKMKANTEAAIIRSDMGVDESIQLSEANSESDKLNEAKSELGDNLVDMDANEKIVKNNSNNNNNNTEGLLVKHRKDGYLELSNNQNNSSSNSLDTETNKLSNNGDGDKPNTSKVQPLPINLEISEDKKLSLKSTDSTAVDNSSADNTNASTKNKIKIVDRAEVNNSQNNVNSSTDGKTNSIDEALSDDQFNEYKNFESLRHGYWSRM